jgi:hypothetical protein
MDISWISSQAKEIHALFVSIFYVLATLLLLIGVLIEYFKMPIGGVPAFSQLIGRALVAAILLAAYPEISNTVAVVADAVADKLGRQDTLPFLRESTRIRCATAHRSFFLKNSRSPGLHNLWS